MIDTSSGRIFPAGERAHTETEWSRSCNTLKHGPFGQLYQLNDDTLAGGKTTAQIIAEDTVMVLLPTVGAIHVGDVLLEAGEVQVTYVQKGTTVTISNPYEHELVNYLQLFFTNNTGTREEQVLYAFDLDAAQNKLLDLFAANQVFASIGKFSGREEAVYETYQPGNGVFVFVIQGAFEVQYRLLEGRDALALWDVERIEIEALSNEAIILVVEIPDL